MLSKSGDDLLTTSDGLVDDSKIAVDSIDSPMTVSFGGFPSYDDHYFLKISLSNFVIAAGCLGSLLRI